MKSLMTQLEILFDIHRILKDGEFHRAEDISKQVGRDARRVRDYIELLRRFYAPIQSMPGQGFRYAGKAGRKFELEITESAMRSHLARVRGLAKGRENKAKKKSLFKNVTQ